MWHAVDVTTIFSDLRGKEQTMKHPQHITFTGSRTTPTDVCRWAQELVRLHARLAPRFARPEPHRRVLAYLQGILSDIARKNSWQVAEHAREARPDGMQRLLSQAVWDTDGVRDAPLAPTRLSSWVGSRPSWSSMKPASPNGGRSRLGWACSIVAQRGKWRTARWASFSRM